MMAEFLPCPFCGGEAILTEDKRCHGHGDFFVEYCVKCKNCGAKGSTKVVYDLTSEQCKALAKEHWNTRTPKERRGEFDG